MEDILWSRGAKVRAELLLHAKRCAGARRPFYAAEAARNCGLSPSAVQEHLALMEERGLLRPVNPQGRPRYLEMTEEGRRAEEEMDALFELGRVLRRR